MLEMFTNAVIIRYKNYTITHIIIYASMIRNAYNDIFIIITYDINNGGGGDSYTIPS